jgi:hypothetical protein
LAHKLKDNMNSAKTPEQVAKLFGCTVEQARAQIERNAKQMRADEIKARASKTGKVRGLTSAWYADRAAAFEAVL